MGLAQVARSGAPLFGGPDDVEADLFEKLGGRRQTCPRGDTGAEGAGTLLRVAGWRAHWP